jgi:hypothetical protein
MTSPGHQAVCWRSFFSPFGKKFHPSILRSPFDATGFDSQDSTIPKKIASTEILHRLAKANILLR